MICENVGGIEIAQLRVQYLTFINTILNLPNP
jgi:hypothetical protein